MISLETLSVGQTAKVLRFAGGGDITQRLLEMGVTPGVDIRLVGSAPLGDPLEFEVRGYRLCLRRSEAKKIEIQT